MFPDPTHLTYLCKLMHRTLGIPVFHLSDATTVQFECAPHFPLNPLQESKSELLRQVYESSSGQALPVIHKTAYEEIFLTIAVRLEDGTNSMIMMGPVLDSHPTDLGLRTLLNDVHIPAAKQEGFVRYYEAIPVVPLIDCVFACMQLYYMLYREPVDPADIYQLSHSLHGHPVHIDHPELQVMQSRQSANFHHDALSETMILQAIKEGNKDKALHSSREATKNGQFGVLSKTSLLRNKKNLAIATVTLATRAAVEGGLAYETALTISDLYIQSVEELRDSMAVDRLIEDVLADFAERVHRNKRKQYSNPINACLDYIFKHLYEDISLSDLAREAALHPNYLSTLFHKEVGRSLTSYIRDTKIEEAATLLRLSDRSITEISTLLNFHDQSYFTKTFKKVMGKTPKQYKNRSGETR
jgi:AraC-like DNA-binding protein